MTWPPGSHYFLFTAIALSNSPIDWSRFMAAFAILWSLVVSQDLDDPKKTLGVDKVGTEEYECLIMFDSRRIARSMAEKWLMKLMNVFCIGGHTGTPSIDNANSSPENTKRFFLCFEASKDTTPIFCLFLS